VGKERRAWGRVVASAHTNHLLRRSLPAMAKPVGRRVHFRGVITILLTEHALLRQEVITLRHVGLSMAGRIRVDSLKAGNKVIDKAAIKLADRVELNKKIVV
jgi:hypothetical protein